MEFAIIIILIGILISIPVTIIIVVRKKCFKRFSEYKEELLKGKSLDIALQEYIDTIRPGLKVKETIIRNGIKYNRKKESCVYYKFILEGDSTWYAGILCNEGIYTEFGKDMALKDTPILNHLLKQVYNKPKREINDEYFAYLSKIDNKYGFKLYEDEKVIFNAIVPNITKDDNFSIGINAKFTMTNERILIYNGAGLWTIYLHDDISNVKREERYVAIDLSKICVFGEMDMFIATGFNFYFKPDDMEKFMDIIEGIIR